MLDLEQGTLPLQAARVAGELSRAADHPVTGDHDGQRVAAHRRADVPRVRPGPEVASQVAVGGRLPVGDLRDQLPHPPVEVGAVRLQGQLERAAVPGEVLTELARDVLEPRVGAGAERRPVGPGPVPRKVQPGQRPVLPDDRQLSEARCELRVRHCRFLSVRVLPSVSRRARRHEREAHVRAIRDVCGCARNQRVNREDQLCRSCLTTSDARPASGGLSCRAGVAWIRGIPGRRVRG